jgi:hypothetical protein
MPLTDSPGRGQLSGSVGQVWFDLPLNDRWSDVTARFTIRQDGDSLYLELDDVHVM